MKAEATDEAERDRAVARKLAALAHPVRLRLLRDLGAADSCCVKDMVGRIGLAQSTVSQHLKVLVDADLVNFRTDRQSSRYTVNSDVLRELSAIIGTTLDRCCAGARCSAAGGGDLTDHNRAGPAAADPAGHKDI
jgi:DNA-binding transcriptional ArsR family regulator